MKQKLTILRKQTEIQYDEAKHILRRDVNSAWYFYDCRCLKTDMEKHQKKKGDAKMKATKTRINITTFLNY